MQSHAIMERTMIAPSKMNKASLPVFKVSTKFPLLFFCIIMGNKKPKEVQFAPN
jgi:hypothetical protein